MNGLAMDQSIPYDPFSTTYLIKDQQSYGYSPSAFYNPLEDFGADSSDAQSPVSPDAFSQPTSASADYPNNSWIGSFDTLGSPDAFKSETFDDSPVVGLQHLPSPISPVVNPMDLSATTMTDDVPFGGSGGLMGLDSSAPLFPSPQLARAQNPRQINHAAAPSSRPTRASEPEITVTMRPQGGGLKRKSSGSSDGSSSPSPPPARRPNRISLPPKKTAHNMIEKRYRNNLNDKISALRDAVPALRVMVHRLETHASGEGGSEEDGPDGISARPMTALDFEEDLGGLTPAHKLNKATILSKATEYIAHLESRNNALARENQGLRSKVEGFEMLVMNNAQRSVWC